MLVHTLITFGAPLLARFTLSRAAKNGWLPAKHYLRLVLEEINNGNLEAALSELDILYRRKSPSLDIQAVTDLLRIKMDVHRRALEKRQAELSDAIRNLEKALQRPGRGRQWFRWLKIWLPGIFTIWAVSSLLALSASLLAPYAGLSPSWIWAGMGTVLALLAFTETRGLLKRQRMVNIYDRFLKSDSAFLRRRLAGLDRERKQLQQQLNRLDDLAMRLQQLNHNTGVSQTGKGYLVHLKHRLAHAVQSYRRNSLIS